MMIKQKNKFLIRKKNLILYQLYYFPKVFQGILVAIFAVD